MPNDLGQRASLAYRNARAEIEAGQVPDKYRRLLPYIQGQRVLEIGAAEGVLGLLLSREGQVERVTALELREDRHREGQRLQRVWAERGFDVSRCLMVQGDIREHLHLLEVTDTLVAVRSIYYLRAEAQSVMEVAARRVRRVVLCGNAGRQAQYRSQPSSELGRFNYLAAIDGMKWLLTGAGYQIAAVISSGDPIVVGIQ
jgi:hypothetical protein